MPFDVPHPGIFSLVLKEAIKDDGTDDPGLIYAGLSHTVGPRSLDHGQLDTYVVTWNGIRARLDRFLTGDEQDAPRPLDVDPRYGAAIPSQTRISPSGS